MAKTFRACEVDQVWMLPATVQELVPENHPAHSVRETVREDLDLSVIGNLKGRGLRQFLLRGLEKVAVEWSLACTAHNLLKLAAARA